MGRKKAKTITRVCARCEKDAPHRLRKDKKGRLVPESPCRRCSIKAHLARKAADPVKTKLRNTYHSMIARCHNPRHQRYGDYGAKGIKVCDRWRESFEAFAADLGPPPSRTHTIDRTNRLLGYEPGNVVWATKTEQSRNKGDNHLVTHDGRTMTVAAWAEELGVPYTTIQSRLRRGWPVQRALDPALAPDNVSVPF